MFSVDFLSRITDGTAMAYTYKEVKLFIYKDQKLYFRYATEYINSRDRIKRFSRLTALLMESWRNNLDSEGVFSSSFQYEFD